MKIITFKQSKKLREADKAFHKAHIQQQIEQIGLSALSKILVEKFGEKGNSPGTIKNQLDRGSYLPIVRLSEKIREALK
jgi:hypothetical protein